jgi:glycosyltransferase involved in cell wall biosynthesis
MKILFLDQTGSLGGAELCLLDTAEFYRDRCRVALFSEGPFRQALEQRQIPVEVLAPESIHVRKQTGWIGGIAGFARLVPLILQTTRLAHDYELIYANTQKALVVGAIASTLSKRPLVYHLHDILSAEHFSAANLKVAVTLANQCAASVIANSQATRDAFMAAGGKSKLVHIVYNGFDPKKYYVSAAEKVKLRQDLGWDTRFIIGHFSRLSPWKGQHILLNALVQCPDHIAAVFVGDALFGETAYVQQLHQQVAELGLNDRVKFLGFRRDIPQLMAACDLVTHTSTAPEPFGRVIVEAMLCQTPVIATAAGGAIELVNDGQTGWLVPPGEPLKLGKAIQYCYKNPQVAFQIASQGQSIARQRFNVDQTNQQMDDLLRQVLDDRTLH